MLDRAIQISVQAHGGQKERNGRPYILHPIRLMLKMESELEMMAAILHDAVEDTHLRQRRRDDSHRIRIHQRHPG